MSNLYVVGTPIGNLEDITLRALRILKEVDVILCEDTRVTKKLLNHYDIHTKTLSYHAHSTLQKVDYIIELLNQGKVLALVSDAGTPAVSDPGSLLVSKIREALSRSDLDKEYQGQTLIKIVAVPGASALTSALSIAGVPVQDFTFLGFLPHKKGRETLFKEILESERAMVFYESTHRILKTLESLKKFMPERKVVIAREITKMFEETLVGTAEELLKILTDTPEKTRGEFVVIVSAKT
jgi:16S rRNA (cytidine1402-2'-O)-methyltransferase